MGRLERPTRPKTEAPEDVPVLEDRLYVRGNEAMKIMGMELGSIAERLPIKRQAYYACLP